MWKKHILWGTLILAIMLFPSDAFATSTGTITITKAVGAHQVELERQWTPDCGQGWGVNLSVTLSRSDKNASAEVRIYNPENETIGKKITRNSTNGGWVCAAFVANATQTLSYDYAQTANEWADELMLYTNDFELYSAGGRPTDWGADWQTGNAADPVASIQNKVSERCAWCGSQYFEINKSGAAGSSQMMSLNGTAKFTLSQYPVSLSVTMMQVTGDDALIIPKSAAGTSTTAIRQYYSSCPNQLAYYDGAIYSCLTTQRLNDWYNFSMNLNDSTSKVMDFFLNNTASMKKSSTTTWNPLNNISLGGGSVGAVYDNIAIGYGQTFNLTHKSSVVVIATSQSVNPSINLSAPLAQTYYSTNVSINFTITGYNATYPCYRKIDGVLNSIGSVANNTLTHNWTYLTGGAHTVNITCAGGASGTNVSVQVSTYIWQGLNISVVNNSTGSAMNNWMLNATNTSGFYTYNLSGQNNPTLIEWNATNGTSVNFTFSDGSATLYYFNKTYNVNVNNSALIQLNATLHPKSANPITLTASPSWSLSSSSPATMSCSASEGQAYLARDGINVSTSYSATLPFGAYTFNCSQTSETENYAPASSSNTLLIAVAGTGCTNNATYAFQLQVIPTVDNYILDFSDLVNRYYVKSDLSDVWINTTEVPANKTVNVTVKWIWVNATGLSSFTIKFGNYYANNSWWNSSATANGTITNVSGYSEINPYYVFKFYNEITTLPIVPPSANSSVSLLCDSGAQSFDLKNSTILISSFEQLREIKTTVRYSATEIYYRNLIINNPSEFRKVYLADANSNQVVQYILTLYDTTGRFGNSSIRIKKPIGGVTESMTEQYFDAGKTAVVYLVNGEKYSIQVISRSGETRIIGDLYVDPVELTRTISIGELSSRLTDSNMGFMFEWRFINNSIIYYAYNDTGNMTYSVEFSVYNATYDNNTLVFYANTTNATLVTFTYSVTDNSSYRAIVKIHHGYFGENTVVQAMVFGGRAVVEVVSAITRQFPTNLVKSMAAGGLLITPMFFGAITGATAGVVVAIMSGIFAYFGWLTYPQSATFIAFALFLAILNIWGSEK